MPFSIIRIKAAVDGYPLSMTSYRHPSPMDAWGFVPFLPDVPNSSRVSFVVGILIPEPSAARTKYRGRQKIRVPRKSSCYEGGRAHKKPAGSASCAASDSRVLIFPSLDVRSSYNFVIPSSK